MWNKLKVRDEKVGFMTGMMNQAMENPLHPNPYHMVMRYNTMTRPILVMKSQNELSLRGFQLQHQSV